MSLSRTTGVRMAMKVAIREHLRDPLFPGHVSRIPNLVGVSMG